MKLKLIAIAVLLATPAVAEPIARGPIDARVVSVYDGDTLTVDAEPWPGLTIRTAVRVLGIDTPEIRGKCAAEKASAARARDFVRTAAKERVQLINVRPDKYGGRVLADVLVNNVSLAELLVAQGYARAYGGGARQGWCN